PAGAEFIGSAPDPSDTTAQGISAQAFSPNYFRRFFIVERELGRGGKGVVFLVKHILDDVFLGRFACKRVPVGNDHEWLKKVLVEVQLLTNLAHPNLVQYKHVWLEDYQISNFGPSVPCAFILQQYCNAGDLHNYMLDSARTKTTTQQLKDRMRRRSKGQPEPPHDLTGPRRMHFEEIFSFFKDITAGLHHLHANGYIHRDLKPSNCLLHRNETGHIRVLVSDFGEVQVVSATRRSTGGTGTISYCAPEVLRRDPVSGGLGNFSTKSDIFSLGMIVYFMCFGRLPYKSADQLAEENEDIEQLRAEIAAWVGFDDHQKQRTDLPDRLYKFLRRLLSLDPNERPSTDDILQNIGGGNDIDDAGISASVPHLFDDIKSRFSSLDSPSPTPQRMQSERRNSALQLGNNGSPVHHKRQQSSRLRPTSPTKSIRREDNDPHKAYVEDSDEDVFSDAQMDSSVILRARKAERGNASAPGSPTRSPQRLLLPPPPTLSTRIARFFSDSFNIGALKVLLFVIKFLSLLQPCAPYAPKAILLYP
ncbi:kinase-like protein, partial [Rhizodiscina lignyota]